MQDRFAAVERADPESRADAVARSQEDRPLFPDAERHQPGVHGAAFLSRKRWTMRPLDGTTLEVIAETICGGSAGGGGANYSTPGPYRSKSEIISFFGRVGVQPRGESSTRKWFVLESLQYLNQHSTADLESVLLRLASPLEYRNGANNMHAGIITSESGASGRGPGNRAGRRLAQIATDDGDGSASETGL